MNLPKFFEALQRVPAASPFHGSPHLRQLARELGPRWRGLFGSTWGTHTWGRRATLQSSARQRSRRWKFTASRRKSSTPAPPKPHPSTFELFSRLYGTIVVRGVLPRARVRQPVSVGVSLVFAFLPVHLSPGWKKIIIIIELLDEFIVRKTKPSSGPQVLVRSFFLCWKQGDSCNFY